jgi:hypothetical protein
MNMARKGKGWITSHFSKIKEINMKYATPRIRMTRGVKIALLLLRIYLLILVLILGYKFYTLVTGGG